MIHPLRKILIFTGPHILHDDGVKLFRNLGCAAAIFGHGKGHFEFINGVPNINHFSKENISCRAICFWVFVYLVDIKIPIFLKWFHNGNFQAIVNSINLLKWILLPTAVWIKYTKINHSFSGLQWWLLITMNIVGAFFRKLWNVLSSIFKLIFLTKYNCLICTPSM